MQSQGPRACRDMALILQDLLVRRWALSAVASERWDAELCPALAALSEDLVGVPLAPAEVRNALCRLSHSSSLEVDTGRAASFLAAAGVTWA